LAISPIASPVQLVFDTNILVDALTARGHYYEYAVQVLEWVQRGEVEGWYAPHTLTTVYYLVEKTLGMQAQTRAQASQAAQAVIKRVVGLLKPLPQVGNEFLEMEGQPGDDLEDLLLVELASQYLPNPVIVTRDKGMLIADRAWEAAHPKEMVERGLAPWLSRQKGKPIEFIDLRSQQRAIWPQLQTNLQKVLHHSQYILGPEVRELESRLAAYVGVEHCVTVASGTEALLISLMALGIGPGDEVITTPFTFVATAEVIVLVGATPVFVDIESDTCNLDVRLIEAKITAKTKAILPVSLYGQPADMDEIDTIAARRGLPVIEDAAQSFGADYKGRKSCNLSTIGCTSFFPSKPLGCYGDGGAIFTHDDDIAQACREIRVHGQSRRYVHTRIGVGGRMDTLQCAIVQAKLERFDWEIQRRLEIGARYNQVLDEAGIPRVQQRPDRTSVFAQYTVFVADREGVQAKLKAAGIPTAVHYPAPLNEQPAYRHLCCPDCTPVASEVAKQVLSLPMSADLRLLQQQTIIQTLSGVRGEG